MMDGDNIDDNDDDDDEDDDDTGVTGQSAHTNGHVTLPSLVPPAAFYCARACSRRYGECRHLPRHAHSRRCYRPSRAIG